MSRDDLLRTVTFYANVTEVNNTPLLLLLINEAACLLMVINIMDRNIILNLGSSVPENKTLTIGPGSPLGPFLPRRP